MKHGLGYHFRHTVLMLMLQCIVELFLNSACMCLFQFLLSQQKQKQKRTYCGCYTGLLCIDYILKVHRNENTLAQTLGKSGLLVLIHFIDCVAIAQLVLVRGLREKVNIWHHIM